MTEHRLTALVVLRTAGEPVSDQQLTADQIARVTPRPGVIDEVTQWFRERGFETGPFAGISFAVSAPGRTFTKTLGEPGDDLSFDLAKLPDHIRRQVSAVTLTPPPAFGPGNP